MNKAITNIRANPKSSLALFCFPYAGAGTSLYLPWKEHIPSDIDLIAVQLPGHETRMREAPFRRMSPLIAHLADELSEELTSPHAFFGHSLGALIAFELARELRRRGRRLPTRLFLSARPAPRSQREQPPHLLDDANLIAALSGLDGMKEEVLLNTELMQVFLPVLKADFELDKTYTYESEPPLNCSISAFGGSKDEFAYPELLKGWEDETLKEFKLRIFPGNHFFLERSRNLLLRTIVEDLYRELP